MFLMERRFEGYDVLDRGGVDKYRIGVEDAENTTLRFKLDCRGISDATLRAMRHCGPQACTADKRGCV